MDQELNQSSASGWRERRKKAVRDLARIGGFNNLLKINSEFKHFAEGADEFSKNLFLKDQQSAEERKELLLTVDSLLSLLDQTKNAQEVMEKTEENRKNAEELRINNLSEILTASRDLEKVYRELDLFFLNAGPEEVEHLTIVNVDRSMLTDPDDEVVSAKVRDLIKDPADTFDQNNVYTFMVIPGYLDEKLIETYTAIAHQYKVLFLTDFQNTPTESGTIDYRRNKDGKKIGGIQIMWSNSVIFANYLRLREKFEELEQEGDLFGSPAMAVAGKLYNLPISQPAYGVQHGQLLGSNGYRYKMNQPIATNFRNSQLNPIGEYDGKVTVWGDDTLFTGDNVELRQYAAVRTFAYIDKSLKRFLNANIGSKLSVDNRRQIRENILDFLRKLEEKNVIEKGSLKRFKIDAKDESVVHIDLEIKPLFVAEAFLYKISKEENKNPATSEVEGN